MHTASQKKLRILLIEDAKGDAILLEKILKNSMPDQHELTHVLTLEDALTLAADEVFDIALLDRTLPDADEFNGLHSLQNIAPQLPIVFLTGYQDEQTSLQAIEQGAQDYILKDRLDGNLIKKAIQYAILRKQFEGVLMVRANYDMLTGLANRMLFESRLDMALARMRRQDGNLAVLFLDLDHFKPVNDTLGHIAGDQVLMQVAKRMKQSLRPYDTVARFGGDEFAILLEALPRPEDSEIVANKVLQLFATPFEVSGRTVSLGVSIGIAVCESRKFCARESLMHQADQAMYAAKAMEGNCFSRQASDAEHAIRIKVS